ncbi:MAG: hypothetical protein ACEY3D_00195 [Rickettsia sp.]|uniref:hypothetical protein n=1 Tax=Rickettsia sp. TaxID=789 RepID=UPI00397D84DF
MSLSDINTRLQNIESKISTLSGMMHSAMITSTNNRCFETYLRFIAKKQMQLEKSLGFILSNLEIRKAWDAEEGLDDFFNNFNKEFK